MKICTKYKLYRTYTGLRRAKPGFFSAPPSVPVYNESDTASDTEPQVSDDESLDQYVERVGENYVSYEPENVINAEGIEKLCTVREKGCSCQWKCMDKIPFDEISDHACSTNAGTLKR